MRFLKAIALGIALSSCVANVQEPTAQSEAHLIFSTSSNVTDQIESYDFLVAATGGYYDKTLYVINSGKTLAREIADMTVSGQRFLFKGGVYPGTGGTCATELNEGDFCTIVLRFSPDTNTIFTGEYILSFSDKVSGTKQSTLSVTGKGGLPASLAISDGPTYDFGPTPIGTSLDYTFTVTNSGEARAVNVSEIGLATHFGLKGGVYPGDGGTCNLEITGGGSCTIVVSFTPANVGTLTDTIDLLYFDGINSQHAQRDVQGDGVLPAVLEISDAPIYSFGTVIVGQAPSPSHVFTVTNTGGLPATGIFIGGLAAPYTFTGGTFPGTLGTCTATVGVGASCTVDVSFTPTAPGVLTDTINIVYNNGVLMASTDRDLTANAVMPASIQISDAPLYDYGTVAVGSINSHSFTLTNTGGVAATVMSGSGLAAPFAFAGGVYPGAGGTCTPVLNAGSSCSVVVQYSPVGTGVLTQTMDITYNNGLAAVTSSRDVQGNALPPANLSISDGPTYDYGNLAIGATVSHTFTVTNSGSVSATSVNVTGLSAPFAFVGGAFPGTGGTCTTTIIAGASCTLVVSFTPTATALTTSSIDMNYNDGANNVVSSRPVQGTGVAPAVLSISDGPTYDFGAAVIGTTVNYTFTVTNTGGIDATTITGTGLVAPFTFTGGAYPGTGGTCGATLAAGANCAIVVSYSPTTLTTDTDTIQLNYYDGAVNQSAFRDVTGQGIPPGLLSISDSPIYDFGTIANSATLTYVFTVTNIGGATTTAMAGSGLAAPFTFLGGLYPGTGGTCGLSLAPTASCTIVIEFAPVATGAYVDTIDINYNDGIGAQVSSRDIQGSGAVPALLSINSAPLFDFSQRAIGSS
ncbi:MAG: choice-of-anchor D domain-containing protein, partial [Bdellovibrionaceae bacterium]|nr:choice-of-anchor D domain-containing protein [Pseudobdellovibrionaceae bacterium]